jgi:ribosomal protein L29
MTSTKKGFRQKPQENRKERLASLEKKLANLEMASRISQMMTQQLMNNMRNMQQDLGRAMGLLNETQYKILAIQEVSGLDLVKMNEVANAKRLTDFTEASDKEDADGNFTVGDVVEKESTIILTSTTQNVDQGIFRSRIKLADCGVPELVNAFAGARVGGSKSNCQPQRSRS